MAAWLLWLLRLGCLSARLTAAKLRHAYSMISVWGYIMSI